MTRAAKFLLGPIFLIQLLLFAAVARHRLVHIDEGFYLLASRLVLMHKRPYVDFFYTQAPLFPFVYSLWMRCFGISWEASRLLAAVLTSLLGTLLYAHVCDTTRREWTGILAVILFCFNTLVLAWFVVAKPYSLAALCLFAAYHLVSRPPKASGWMMAAAGLLLALAVDARSYLLIVLPVFLWWIVRSSVWVAARNSASAFVAGFAVGIMPCLYLFIENPDAFLFDNLGYHAVRSGDGLVGWWQQKLVVVLQLFLGGREANGLQWSLLFIVALGFIFTPKIRRYPARLAFVIAIAVSIVSLLPTPTYVQYFCLCIPFLIVSAVCASFDVLSTRDTVPTMGAAVGLCALILVCYVSAPALDLPQYFSTRDSSNITAAHSPDTTPWSVKREVDISKAIDEIARPGEAVASFWPGDIFQTRAVPVLGLANDFGLLISDRLSEEQRTKYQVLSSDDIEGQFSAHMPRVVVLRDRVLAATTSQDLQRMRGVADRLKNALGKNGYTVAKTIGDVDIYVCCSKP